MKRAMVCVLCLLGLVPVLPCAFASGASSQAGRKPDPEAALRRLQDGNERFCAGRAEHPHTDAARLALAAREDQGTYAYATVIACSDSRVPVERIFDAGVMDLFVIRVAGNVCGTDEIGSIEYGLAHVHTPVFVMLGHTQCGAVTAVARGLDGRAQALERNIPPLVDNIVPAVRRAVHAHPGVHGDDLIPHAVEENVWQGIEDLFMKSPAVRGLVREGKVIVAGAVYDVGTGRVAWLPRSRVDDILEKVEASPDRETEAFLEPDRQALHLSAALSRVKLFRALPDAQRNLLMSAATLRRGDAGEHIVVQGRPLDRMFVLLEGSADVRINGRHVVTLSDQPLIGEIEFLDGRPASAEVILREAADFIELPYAALNDLMEQHPRLGYVLMREIAGIEAARLRNMNPK